jgi:hypothetical protein
MFLKISCQYLWQFFEEMKKIDISFICSEWPWTLQCDLERPCSTSYLSKGTFVINKLIFDKELFLKYELGWTQRRQNVPEFNCISPTVNLWFVYLLFYVPLKNFSLLWRRQYYRWMATKFRTMLVNVFGQEGTFIVPHLLWHGASFFQSHPKDRPI